MDRERFSTTFPFCPCDRKLKLTYETVAIEMIVREN